MPLDFDHLYSKLFNEMPVTLPAPTKPAPTRTPTRTPTPSQPVRPDRPWLPTQPKVAPRPRAVVSFDEEEEMPDASIAKRDAEIYSKRRHHNRKVTS